MRRSRRPSSVSSGCRSCTLCLISKPDTHHAHQHRYRRRPHEQGDASRAVPNEEGSRGGGTEVARPPGRVQGNTEVGGQVEVGGRRIDRLDPTRRCRGGGQDGRSRHRRFWGGQQEAQSRTGLQSALEGGSRSETPWWSLTRPSGSTSSTRPAPPLPNCSSKCCATGKSASSFRTSCSSKCFVA